MKKFLTVLLALSVVFTYSFSAVGTAFAADATNADKAAKLAEAKTVAENMVNAYYNDAMDTVVDNLKTALNSTEFEDADYEAAWSKVDVKSLLSAKIAEEYVEEAKTLTKYADDAATYAANVFALSTKDTDGTELTASAITGKLATKIETVGQKLALLNLYNAKKADIMAALDNVDYSLYLNTVDPTNADEKTYLQQAQDKVAKAKEDAKGTTMVLDEESIDDQAVTTAVTAVKALVSGTVEPIMISGTTYESGLYKVIGVSTKEQVEAADREDSANIATIKAAIQQAYVVAMNAGADKDNATAYVTVCNYLAEKGFIADTAAIPAYGTVNWKGAVSEIEELTAFAAKYKAEKDATGAFVRDAEAVDAEVEKATNHVYGTVANNDAAKAKGQSVADAKTAIDNMSVKTDAAKLAFAKDVAKKALEDAKAKVADTYYPLEAEKVEAKYAAILAEIEAANTVTKVTTAKNKIATAADGIATKSDVDNAINWTSGAAKVDLDDVKYQIGHLNRGKTILDADYIDATDNQIKEALAKIYGEAGARTDKEIKALKTDTAAVAASLPTVGGKAAAKKAVEDAINPLPAKATESDLAAVEAAAKAVKDYEALGGVVDAKLTNKLETAKSQVKTDMLKNLTIAYAQLDKTDKEAVKALKEKIDAAVELAKKDNLFGNGTADDTTFNTLKNNIGSAMDSIRDAELANVIKAINAIPINVTEADRATVEAARKAYDAFVAEWTSYDAPGYNAAAQVTNFRELALAEAALAILEKDAAIKATESLKITASSTAKKGSITVKWTVVGDDSYADGYRVYRSLKRNSGYGATPYFITKAGATQYKNTKGLKKGTRYYYKVRAYVEIDGVKYYSDYSNKAYRIAK